MTLGLPSGCLKSCLSVLLPITVHSVKQLTLGMFEDSFGPRNDATLRVLGDFAVSDCYDLDRDKVEHQDDQDSCSLVLQS